MSMFKQTDDQDFAIENNGFLLVDGKSQIRQRIINELKSFFGEWFLDLTLGVPWFQVVFEKGQPPGVIEFFLKDRILGVEGVLSFERFEPLDLEVATRELSVDFDVRTSDGEIIEVEETLP